MARKKEKDSVYINYVFPRDYELLERMLTVKIDEINLNKEYITKLFLTKSFQKNSSQVHPEKDLPSKMRSMFLLKQKGLINFAKGCKMDNIAVGHKGNTIWKEYLFQMPNIEQILGIKRDFGVHNLKDLFQNPFLFLLYLYLEVGLENVLNYVYFQFVETIMDIIERAILAYEEEQRSANFTYKQMGYIFFFFWGLDAAKNWKCDELNIDNIEELNFDNIEAAMFGDEEIEYLEAMSKLIYEQEIYGGWDVDYEIRQRVIRYEAIESKINEIMESFVSKFPKSKDSEIEELKITHKKGEIIYYPVYMSSIINGIQRYYNAFPLMVLLGLYNEGSENEDKGVNEEGKKERKIEQTLWSYKSVFPINNIDEELWKSYCNIHTYTTYKRKMELCRAKINTISDMGIIGTCLETIYTFYVGMLATVFSDKNYKEAAQDAVERMFSLYLFRVETDLLYKKVVAVGALLEGKKSEEGKKKEEEEENERLKIAKYVVKAFSQDVLHDLYCSPGIHHRIYLAEYINRIDISPDDLAGLYLANQGRDEIKSPQASRIRRKIEEINKEYLCIEEKCIMEFFSDQQGRDLNYLNESCRKNDRENGYGDFYDEIRKEIDDKRKENANKINRPTVKKMVKKILNENEFRSPAYKLIHFWVIFSSYFPREFSWVTLKNE